jgi:hypothetical protein
VALCIPFYTMGFVFALIELSSRNRRNLYHIFIGYIKLGPCFLKPFNEGRGGFLA